MGLYGDQMKVAYTWSKGGRNSKRKHTPFGRYGGRWEGIITGSGDMRAIMSKREESSILMGAKGS